MKCFPPIMTLFILLLIQTNLGFAHHKSNTEQGLRAISDTEVLTRAQEPRQFRIGFTGTRIAYNNKVGNEWVEYIKFRGQNFWPGQHFDFWMSEGQTVSFTCYLQETNEKHIDWAKEEVTIDYSELLSAVETGFFVPVTITEGNGRYAGNKAQMNFYFEVSR